MQQTDPDIDWKQRAKDSGFPAFPVAIKKDGQGKFQKIPMVAGWTKNAYFPDDWPDEVWARAQGYGVPTGAVSGLYVLDVDDYKQGTDADVWMRQHKVPATAERDTISGGRHRVFKLPSSHQDTPNRAGVVPGLDGRGEGGYFVGEGALGSFSYAPIVGDLTELPEEICEELKAGWNGGVTSTNALAIPQIDQNERQRLRELVTNNGEVLQALTNGRNDGSEQLFHVAGACARAGISRDDFAGIVACSDRSSAHAHVFKYFDQADQERALGRAWDRANPSGSAEFEGLELDSDAAVSPSSKKAELEDLFGAEAVERAEEKKELGPIQKRFERFRIPKGAADTFDATKSVPAVLKGLLPQQGMGVIYGASGIGKSFVTMDMVFHIASGNDWQGYRNKARDGVWVYISSEGGSVEIIRRMRGWQDVNGKLPSNVEVLATEFSFGAEGGEDASQIIKWCRRELKEPVRGIVIDTLNRNMAGDENSTADMTGFVDCAARLWRALDCLVMVVHHEGKDADRGSRGSSALKGAAEFEWRVYREPQVLHGGVFVAKNRHGQDGMNLGFNLDKHVLGTDEDGDEVSTLVVTKAAPPSQHKPVTRKYSKSIVSAYEQLAPAGSGWIDVDTLTKKAADVHEEDHGTRPHPGEFKRELKEHMVSKNGWQELDDAVRPPNREQDDEKAQ